MRTGIMIVVSWSAACSASAQLALRSIEDLNAAPLSQGAINQLGHTLIRSTAPLELLLISGTERTSIALPADTPIESLRLNSFGDILLTTAPPIDGSPRSFIYTAGAWRQLDPMAAATDIDEQGFIVGTRQAALGQSGGDAAPPAAFRVHASSSMLNDLASVTEPGGSRALAASTSGRYRLDQRSVNGSWITTRVDTQASDAQQLPLSFLFDDPRDINDAGMILGLAFTTDATTMYRTGLEGQLETLALPSAWLSIDPVSINNAGYAIGNAITFDETFNLVDIPFVWTPEGEAIELASLLREDTAIELSSADAINDAGQVLVRGFDAQGSATAFLLNLETIPSPGTLTILALASCIRRRR